MVKQSLYGAILIGAVLCVSLPMSAMAERDQHRGRHGNHNDHHGQHKHDGRHYGKHRRHHAKPHRHHWHRPKHDTRHHGHHWHHHRGYSGFRFRIFLGSRTGYDYSQFYSPTPHPVLYLLETAPSGATVPWRDPDRGQSGTITPMRTYQTASGQYCREYQQTAIIGGEAHRAYGTACRQPDGSWQTAN